jgi:hypothetical protein
VVVTGGRAAGAAAEPDGPEADATFADEPAVSAVRPARWSLLLLELLLHAAPKLAEPRSSKRIVVLFIDGMGRHLWPFMAFLCRCRI